MPPKTACPGDEEIREAVRALQSGAGPDAFGPIFRRFYRPLLRFFANRPSLREEAEDLAQATLARAYQNIAQYREAEGASFASWLRTIGENVWRNAVREHLAAKRAPPQAAAELPAEADEGEEAGTAKTAPSPPRDRAPDPEQIALAYERTRVLRQAIEALPPGMRQCMELRLFGELKYQEIADITGIGLNSVRSQLFEARKRLQPVLDDYFQGADF